MKNPISEKILHVSLYDSHVKVIINPSAVNRVFN